MYGLGMSVAVILIVFTSLKQDNSSLTDASNQCDPVFAKHIDGIHHTLGSNRDRIDRSIDEARAWTE